MTLLHLPTLVSFLALSVLGSYVFLRNKEHLVNLLFALAMASLALMEFGNFMALVHLEIDASLFWKRIALVGECLIPGTWLAFSMTFARKKPWYSSKQWKMVFILIGGGSAFFAASAASGLFVTTSDSPAILSLGGVGKAFYICFLLGVVAIVATLEHTIRQSKGDQRAKIRSLVLGVGGFLVFLIFLASQNLLFCRVNLGMVPASSSVFLICTVLIAFSAVRHRLMNVNLYISRFVIYNSLTILLVGGYLISVGVVSQIVRSFNLIPGFPLEILFLFLAILLLSGLFLSDQIRWKARMLINKHFYRGRYDYREEWLKFSEGLSLKLDVNDLVSPVVNMLRDSLGVKRVSLWLADTTTGTLSMVGPGPSGEKGQLKMDETLLNILVNKKTPFSRETPWARSFFLENSEIATKLGPSVVVPMVSARELIGLILLGKKTTGEPFLSDDIDLLRSAGAQIASAIVNARLSQELVESRQMEMFHRLSSFVLHDLKNLVSSLSLIVQNAAEHMTNPWFQQDAIETIGRSVDKMETLIATLSNSTGDLRPNLQEVNLNDVVSDIAAGMDQKGRRNQKVGLQTDLARDVPGVMADREQMEKVVGNLLLNAFEALGDGGRVTIKTKANEGAVILSVSDNGRGIPRDFVENALFKPFSSTKKKGLGIGLYQCKTIVENHGGKIEVDSTEGVGTTFRVVLPMQKQRGSMSNAQ